MKRPNVYIAKDIPKQVENYIAEFCDYEKWENEKRIPRDEVLKKIKDKDGVLLSGIKIDKEFLDNAPNLKIVSNVSVGYNNFDLEVMKERNIIGTTTPNVLDDTVADLIFGLILSTARRLCEFDKYVKDGKWRPTDDRNLFGLNVHHSTLGIIGMGRIGEAVAKRAKLGFDMEVLYHNRHRKNDVEEKLEAKFCELEYLLKNSDFILLMTPLTNETYHLIDSKEFDMMKKTAIFINASRGQTVNEEALIETLENKKIFAAGLDVYEKEPIDPENPLLKLSNAVTFPHLGSSVEKTRADMAMAAAENLVKGLLYGTAPDTVSELRQ